MKSKNISLIGILSAVSVVLLYIASALPTMRLTLVAIAGLVPAIAVLRAGIPYGAACYGISSVLALLMIPSKSCAFVYILLFGHYPIVKSFIERINRRYIEWVIKILFFNTLFTILYFFAKTIFADFTSVIGLSPIIIYASMNIAFIIYDIGFSGLIVMYLKKFNR